MNIEMREVALLCIGGSFLELRLDVCQVRQEGRAVYIDSKTFWGLLLTAARGQEGGMGFSLGEGH